MGIDCLRWRTAPAFSAVLCLRGAVHALAGFYTNPQALHDGLRFSRRKLAAIAHGLTRCLRVLPARAASPSEPVSCLGGVFRATSLRHHTSDTPHL